MTRLYLGVDGGQSSTTAMLGDATGRVLGLGRGGPCNHVSGPERRERFLGAMRAAVGGALAAAGLDPRHGEFAAGCFGFSGGAEDKRDLIAGMFSFGRLLVTTDALIALVGATAGRPGLITIAGTGSIAFGRNARGQTARAGGWGYVFGDEGGGFDLVRQALRAALRQEEGWGPPTRLGARLLEATGAASANELLHWFYRQEWPRPRIAALARLVDEVAAEGDPVAAGLIHRAAQDLATLASAVRRQLFTPGEQARVAYIGGVFRSARLRERYRELVELEDGNQCGPPEFGPAAGALIEAYGLDSLTVSLTQVPEEEK